MERGRDDRGRRRQSDCRADSAAARGITAGSRRAVRGGAALGRVPGHLAGARRRHAAVLVRQRLLPCAGCAPRAPRLGDPGDRQRDRRAPAVAETADGLRTAADGPHLRRAVRAGERGLPGAGPDGADGAHAGSGRPLSRPADAVPRAAGRLAEGAGTGARAGVGAGVAGPRDAGRGNVPGGAADTGRGAGRGAVGAAADPGEPVAAGRGGADLGAGVRLRPGPLTRGPARFFGRAARRPAGMPNLQA
ncbi:putative 3,5-diaminohexanoate dehydrogenase [Streptomyces misionensis JCM 4497]